MNEHAQLISTLQSIHRAFLRHRLMAAGFFVAGMLLVAFGLWVAPRTYESEAKLFVRVGRESITVDPTATVGQTISVYDSRESEINSVLEVIQSRVILDRALDHLGIDAILPGHSDSAASRESAIRALNQSLEISRGRKSSVITVRSRASSPELAQKIATAVLDAFQQVHMQVNRTDGSYEFFVKQADILADRLAESSQELSDTKNVVGVVTVDVQHKTLQEQITAIETARVTAESELGASEAKVVALREKLASLPPRLVTLERQQPNLSADATRLKLDELKIREQDLLSKFTELHPQVMAVQQQIAEAEGLLAQQRPHRTETTSANNPAYQQMEVALLTEESLAASLRAKVRSLHEQSQRLGDKLKQLNDHEGLITRLEKEVELLQLNYRAYSEKLEQARIDQALEQQLISNVNVAQPPTYISKPIAPAKLPIVVLGFFVSALGAVCFPYLAEQVDWSRFVAIASGEPDFSPVPSV